MGGQSCYDLIAKVELPLSFFLEKSYTNTLSIYHALMVIIEPVCRVYTSNKP